ncbi:MAG: type II toxin-antitoxin system VapC family toxin [Microcystaceae cyanobacterium]
MSLWILDTDHITLFQMGHPLIVQRINLLADEEIASTIISVEEQVKGWLNAIKQSKQSSKLLWAYEGLQKGVVFFNTVRVIEFDQSAYSYYQELRKQKIRIGTQDLRIASIVLSKKAILVTRNRRDFEQIQELILEDWSI